MGYILLILFIVLFGFAILISNGELFSPSVLLGVGYLISILCYIYNINNWKSNGNYATLFVLVSGYVLIIFTETVISRIYKSKKRNVISSKACVININSFAIIFFDVLSIIICYLYLISTFKLAERLGYDSSSGVNIVEFVRRATMNGGVTVENKMNTVVTQSIKLVAALAYLFMYVFINNYIQDGCKKSNHLKYLFIPVLYVVFQVFLGGNRLRGIRVFFAGTFFYYIVNCRKNNSMHALKIKQYIKIIIGAIGVIVAFKILTKYIGRGIGSNFIDYITSYLGGGIENFNTNFIMYYKRIQPSNYWGNETFYFVWDFLKKLGLSDFNEKQQLEFNMIGILNNNVYTGYRKTIHDFGYMGMYICHFIMSLFYCVFYYKYLRRYVFEECKRYVWYSVLYGYLGFALLFHFFDNYFYQQVSLDGIVTIFFLYILYKYLIKKPLRQRIKLR